jgi:hypothetical protein
LAQTVPARCATSRSTLRRWREMRYTWVYA